MKKVILSLFVLGSILAINAAEQVEQPADAGNASGTLTPVPLGDESGDPVAKQGVTVEGTGEKPAGDDAVPVDTDAGKKAKGKEGKDSKKGCTIF